MAAVIRRFVRVGYAAKGVIYLLIGALALRLAVGSGGRLIDEHGVLQSILGQPLGRSLLAVIGVGLLAYASWEVTRAVAGGRQRGWVHRFLSIFKGITYGAIGLHAVRLVLGARERASDVDDLARSAMRFPLGEVVLALAGAGIAMYGLSQMRQAWNAQFDDDLDHQRLRSEGGGWVLAIGRAGIGARGIILAVIGLALVRAALDERPSAAKGIPDALATLFAQPFGPALMGAVAGGLVCFGVFQLLHARYARV